MFGETVKDMLYAMDEDEMKSISTLFVQEDKKVIFQYQLHMPGLLHTLPSDAQKQVMDEEKP